MFIKGQKINDRYQIIRTIGDGGMADVYLAFDTILERNVAVKVLRGTLSNDEKFVRRFQREALSASSLSHPNIVEVYDVGEENDNYYIVMEYIEGKNLKELIKKRNHLTLFETTDIMLQLTDGLAEAHEAYIIHRDIKPQNMLMLKNGMVKITDFGIALATNNASLTQTNSVMGSVHYLPPEQASGKGSTIKSDIYSLGVLMFELLTGKVPFKGETAVEIALKHMKETFPSIKKINPDIPQSIENIILKCCAKNPKNRYNNVREMHQDLLTCLNDERIDESKVEYKYLEQELDDTKSIPVLREEKFKNDAKEVTEKIAVQITNNDNKKQRTIVLVLACILLCLTVFFSFVVLILPNLKEVKEVIIPDVSNLSVVDAESELKSLGLEVAEEVKELHSDEIVKDYVIKTSPIIGRKVKEGTEITLYISLGTTKITIEDYTGQNALNIEGALETLGINVLIEKMNVEDSNEYDENEIIDQSIEKDTEIEKDSTITLYIPNKAIYPNMVLDNWNEDAAQEFAESYNIDLTVIEKVSTMQAGTVLYQSRTAGTNIVNGSTLTIHIAVPEILED